ncbi:hypothetical protein COP2_041704 [Malus domestica]
MQKTMIMEIEAYSSAERIKKLEFEIVALKGSNISAPTSLQLEIASKEIVDLKTRLNAIQVKYENVEKEIGRYIPKIQDVECAASELRSAAYAKDGELITSYNQVIHFKKIIDRLEPQVLELQGALKINDNLKKELDELQRVCVGLLEENEQLKASIGEVVGEIDTQVGVARGEALDDATDESVTAAKGVVTE